MKNKSILFFSLLIAFLLFSLSIGAEDREIETGKGGDNVSWTLYDRNSEESETPDYYLVFSGSGNIKGYSTSGGGLSYGNRDDSQFSPWKDFIHAAIIEDGITGIEGAGLAFLPELRTVELPADLTYIGGAAFESDPKLHRISVRGERTFLGADLSKITEIGAYAFDGCKELRYLKLNPDLKGDLQTEAFKGLAMLKSVTIPKGIKSLRADVFENCSGLESIVFLGDPNISSSILNGVKKTDIKIYGSKAGGNAEAFAKSKGYEFINSTPTIPSDFYDENAIDIGKCGTAESELYYKIMPEDSGYTMYTFGSGSTMTSATFYDTSVGYWDAYKICWYKHRELITKVIISDGVKTLTGLACGFMPNLKEVEIPKSLNAITGACFEASKAFGTLYTRGDEPIEGHVDLTGITKLGSYTFDGCSGIKTVEFAEKVSSSTQYLGTEYFKNCTNLESVKLPFNIKTINKSAFLNCQKLTTLTIYSNATIDKEAFNGCSSLKSIAGLKNSHAQAFAEANGLEFIFPNVVSVIMNGEKTAEIDVVDGCVLNAEAINDIICLLYEAPDFTVPYDYNQKLYDDITLYALPLLSHEGFMVRTAEYNGLRAIYNMDIYGLEGDELYSVTELGVIASFERGIRETTHFDHDGAGVFKSISVKNDSLTGKLISYPEGRNAKIAYTAVGYDKNGKLDMKSATEALYFRGYAIITNKESGQELLFYTSVKSATLKEKAAATLESGESILGSAEKQFLKKSAEAEYDRTAVYTKAELLSYMQAMYDDIDHVLFGQHIDCSSVNSFANNLASIKNKTGEYPAVAAIDQGTVNGGKMTPEELEIFRNDMLEYVRRGGIISVSFHMDNPNDESLYCRGTLGMGDAFDDLMTSGTERNDSLMRSLATAAETLQFFEDAGVPVLWRPLHEMNGGWFWWCTVQSGKVLNGEYVARLWRYFYNYLENECGLDNLIWVYSPNYSNNTSTTSGTQDVMHCYPGDKYVDIVGVDWYSSTGSANDLVGAGNSYPKVIATGKPACVTEFGPSGDLLPVDGEEHPFSTLDQLEMMYDLRDKGLSMIYILNWSGHWSIASMKDPAAYTADPMIYGASKSYEALIGCKLK